MTTGIEWTDETWNPVTGCSKVSPGCAHCYAEKMALTRLTGRTGYPGLPWTSENAKANVMLRPERLALPLSWKKPRRVFVNSMSDLCHELVPDDFVVAVFAAMLLTPRHTYQVLTKRPERMRAWVAVEGRLEQVRRAANLLVPEDASGRVRPEYLLALGDALWPLPNVWLGRRSRTSSGRTSGSRTCWRRRRRVRFLMRAAARAGGAPRGVAAVPGLQGPWLVPGAVRGQPRHACARCQRRRPSWMFGSRPGTTRSPRTASAG